jgi:ligand-binding sensor domain-containing protein
MLKSFITALLFSALAVPISAQDANPTGSAKPTGQESRVTLRAPKRKLTRTQGSDQYRQVRCGLQDKAGILWFGTTGEGVYSYDGKGFTQYTVQDGLNSNTVWSILEDKQGRIWFGTDSGPSRWDGKSIRSIPIPSAVGLFAPSIPSPSQTFPAQTSVWSMLEDRRGTIWFGTSGGVFR